MPKTYQQAAWKALSIFTALTLVLQGSAFLFVPQIAQAAPVPLFPDNFEREANSNIVGNGWEEALQGIHNGKEEIESENRGANRFVRLHGENTEREAHADHPKAAITHEIPGGGDTNALLTFRWRGDDDAAVLAKLLVLLDDGSGDEQLVEQYSIKNNPSWSDPDEELALPNEVCDGGFSLTFRSTANNNNVTVDIDDVRVTCEEEQQTANIRAFKYFDADQNEMFNEDGGDYPLSGWRFSLYTNRGGVNIDPDDPENPGNKLLMLTGEDGYTDWWTDVPVENPDDLVLQEDPSVTTGGEMRVDWESWAAINPSNGTYWGLAFEGDGPYTFEFGNWQPSQDGPQTTTITGYKFHDLDRNGRWYVPNGTTNEPGIEGWTVALGRVGEPEGDGPIPIEIVAMDLTGGDCNVNGVPDACDIDSGENPGCNDNEIPDECNPQDNGRFDIDISGVEPGEYKLFEEQRDGWVTTNPPPFFVDSFFDITYRIDFAGQEVPLVQDSFFDVFIDPDGHAQISWGGEPVPEALFGNRDAAPPQSRFDEDVQQALDHTVIDTEILSLDLRGTTTDNHGIGGEGSDVTLKIHEVGEGGSFTVDSFFDITYRIDFLGAPGGAIDSFFDVFTEIRYPSQSFFDVFTELNCDTVVQRRNAEPLPGDPAPPIPIEIVSLQLQSVDPMTVQWGHNWNLPGPGIYCFEAVATDDAGNVEHTAIAGPVAYVPVPEISEERTSTQIGDVASFVATWVTDHLATSRVIYDSVPHPDPLVGDGPCPAPNDAFNCYGYALSTPEDPVLVLHHTVVVSGLAPATTYYYRTVSHGSPEAVGGEQQFTTPGGAPPGGNGADFGAPPASPPQGNNEEPASPPPPNEPSQPPPSPSSEQGEQSAPPASAPAGTPAGGSTSGASDESAGEVLGLATEPEPSQDSFGAPLETPPAQEQNQPTSENPSLMASLADLLGSWWWVPLFAAIILAIVAWMRRSGESHA